MMFGLLNVDKPAGWTSRDVVNRVARLVKPAKVGHAGTLDPLATGVLLICVGPATRLVPYLHEHSKTYVATFLFGKSSTTDDIEGEVTDVPVRETITRADIEQILSEFTGNIEQIPPAYSAIKINGERAYKAARRGENIDIPPRTVTVHRIDVIDFSFPQLSVEIECGTGTYVRSIGRDLARRMGTEAIMSQLTRTRIGQFDVQDASPLDTLTSENIADRLSSPLTGLFHLCHLEVDDRQVQSLRYGQTIDPGNQLVNVDNDAAIAIVDAQGDLIAISRKNGGRLAPQIVFPMKQ